MTQPALITYVKATIMLRRRSNITNIDPNNQVTQPHIQVDADSDVNFRNLTPPFSFRNVDFEVVRKSIMEVSSRAVGLDEIPISFVKMTLPVTLPYISQLKSVLTSSIFPDAYKKSKVFPVHEKSAKHELKDHSGVHVLPALSKSLEKVMKWQMSEYINGHDLLYNLQSGYRSKHSTATALLKVTHDIRKNLHMRLVGKKFVSVLLLLDFSNIAALQNQFQLLTECPAIKPFDVNDLLIELVMQNNACDEGKCLNNSKYFQLRVFILIY